MIKVVVVEDEKFVRQGIVLTMDWKSIDCVVVGEASNGEEGLRVIRSLNPDLVITDVQMPKMDGLTMISKLREEHCTAEFIILTAYSDFTYAHAAVKLGVTDYLLKPFDDNDLHDAMDKVIARIAERDAEKAKSSASAKANAESESSEGDSGGDAFGHQYSDAAVAYIRDHYKESVSLDDAAAYLNISSGYLSRVFKRDTGYTFVNYLTNYRIQLALELLRNTHLKVYEVAEQVGYTDTNYFSNIFRRQVGLSPSEYQDKNR